jgi:L-malate glycosyltransferase
MAIRNIDSVVLTGPLAPNDLASHLHPADRDRAAAVKGYRGIPTSELTGALLASGMNVEVVTHAEGLDSPQVFEGPRLRIAVAPRRRRARVLAHDLFRVERRELARLLKQAAGDIVHAHWTYEFAWAAQTVRRPLLVTAHDAPLTILRHYKDAYRSVRALMAYIVRLRLGHLTVVSPYLARQWRTQMLYRRPIRVIPNIARDLTTGPERRVQDGSVRNIIDIADASPRKNVELLVRAVDILRRRGRDVSLTLVGSGLGEDGLVASRLRSMALHEGVHFRGVHEGRELGDLLNSADLFVHPSKEECCPVSVIEAMQAGLPVVVGSEAGGAPWVVGDGEAGKLANISSVDELVAAIEPLLDSPELARDLAERGRTRAATIFSGEVVAQQYIDEYERVRAITRWGDGR